MADFKTSAELAQRYAVSERVLLAYARRGNLAMCRQNSQQDSQHHSVEWLFSEQNVARLFRRRWTGTDLQPALGVLGVSRVGDSVVSEHVG